MLDTRAPNLTESIRVLVHNSDERHHLAAEGCNHNPAERFLNPRSIGFQAGCPRK